MLKFNLNHIFKARGIKRPYTFLRKLGLSHTVAHRIANGSTKSMSLEHMEKVCTSLHCTPNDLIEWETDGISLPNDHPLNELVRSPQAFNLVEELKDIPLDRLEELKEQIRSMKNESKVGE